MNCPVRISSFLAAAAAVIGLVGLCTFAEHVQAQANAPPAVAPAPRLKLTTEQEYIIREIVLKDLNVQKENSAPETIGDSVPDDVKLDPLPPEVIQKVPRAQSHQFFVKDGEVVLVSHLLRHLRLGPRTPRCGRISAKEPQPRAAKSQRGSLKRLSCS
jgi:hypothetical protein